MGSTRPAVAEETLVAAPRWMVVLVWAGLPVLGAGLGWLLLPAADWLATLRWTPLGGPVELLTSLPRGPAVAGAVAVGGLGGLALAFLVVRDSLRVSIRGDLAVLTREGSSIVVSRADVSVVFLDDERLALLDRDGGELAREPYELGREPMAEAFRRHGWPWRDGGDPYRDRYRRWVPDLPELPAGADALFAARQRALERGDGEDATALRAELGRLGVVVRDDKKRQHWRLTTPSR